MRLMPELVVLRRSTKSLMVDSSSILKEYPRRRQTRKKSEYAAQVEANLSRMYQNYLDRLSEEVGRKIAKEDLDTPEKREQLAQEWKSRGLGEQSDPTPAATRDGESKRSSSKRKK